MNHIEATDMDRWSAASGYVVLLLGIAGAAFERGGPPANAPIEQSVTYFSTYRTELLAQSVMFVFSAGAYLWFFGALRAALVRAEDDAAPIATIVFGAGLVSVTMQMMLQTFQIATVLIGGEVNAAQAALLVSLMWTIS